MANLKYKIPRVVLPKEEIEVKIKKTSKNTGELSLKFDDYDDMLVDKKRKF